MAQCENWASFVWHACFWGITNLSLLTMSFMINVVWVINVQGNHDRYSLVFEIWIGNSWFHMIILCMRFWLKITELDFCFFHRYAAVHIQWVLWCSVSSLAYFFNLGTSCLVCPADRISTDAYTIAWLLFDHLQWFELTDRFFLQLYGEFNWNYCQIGLLLPVAKLEENG